MTCHVEAANARNIAQFADAMCLLDRRELITWYQDERVLTILLSYLHMEAILAMLCNNNEPVAFFGCAFKKDVNKTVGVPFLMSTDNIRHVTKSLVEYTHEYLKLFLERCFYLFNYVDSRNHVHLRYLHHFGFTIDKEHPILVNNVYFYPFYRMV